jgi:hypothetical protein
MGKLKRSGIDGSPRPIHQLAIVALGFPLNPIATF